MSKEQQKYIKKLKKEKISILITQILIITIFLITWQLLSKYEIINSFIFSSPDKIIGTIKDLIITKEIFIHIFTTLYELIIAFTLGLSISFIISLILYIFPIINKIIDPFLTMINSLPKVALGPILIIWCGANTKTIIVMALLINIIVSITTILNGFNNIDNTKITLMKSFNANKLQIITNLIIPGSKKNIISAMKLNISMTLIGVIMGEFLVSRKGIGYLIIYGTQIFNLDLVLTGITILLIISYLLYKLILIIEKKYN